MSLVRPNIPLLDACAEDPLRGVIVERSFPFGKENPLRYYVGEKIPLAVKLDTERPARVAIHTNLNKSDQLDFTEAYLETRVPGEYYGEFLLQRAGSYIFRIKVSFDQGKTWHYDNLPFTRVIVDPSIVAGLRMYTLIPNVSGPMRQWKESLQRIKSLGFNAVQILPITELDVSESPYSAKDFFNIDPAFLDPNDRRDGLSQFEDFVEEAARLGLRLCVDLVLNHVGASSKIVKLRPQWIAPDISQPDGMKRAGCWIGTNWHTWGDLVLINYEHPDEDVRHDIWTYMAQYAHFWAYYAHYTGGLVRFDNLHSSDPAFVSVLCKSLRTRFPNLTFLVEFFTDHNTLIERAYEWNLNLLLGTPWEHKFVPQLRGFLDYTHRVFNKTRFITPLSSHDSGSPAQEFGNPNSTIPRYVMCALGGCGATGIVQGVEWGIQSKINFIGRNGTLPPGSGHDYSDLIRRVNAMLAEYPAFQRGGNTKFIDNNHNAIIACLREVTGQDSKFIVVANFDVTDGQWISLDLAVHFPKARELLVESLLYPNLPSRTTSRLELPMPPCGAQVFRVTPVG